MVFYRSYETLQRRRFKVIQKILGLPPLASAHGGEIDFMIFLLHVLVLILFIGWGIFFVIVLLKFNRFKNPKANYHGVTNHYSTYIEVGVAIAEIVLLVAFSVPFWAKNVSALPTAKDPVVVRVVAEQFVWNIHYPGKDGVFGRSDMKFFDKQSNPLGLDPSDAAGKDDIITINQLYLPMNRQAVIHLSSKDVIHSFSLNVMRVKQDVIPGMSIPAWFTPIKTGNFEISCAQLCGLGHYRMRGYLTIQTQREFDQWLDTQSAAQSQSSGDDFWN